MSDSKDSMVTYTEVSSPFADLSDIGSPGVDGLPVMPEDPYAYVVAAFQAPPSPNYVLGPEEPKQAPPSPVYVPYVPDPAYPEFMPPEEEILLAKEQPLPAALSPTADLPGYVPEDDRPTGGFRTNYGFVATIDREIRHDLDRDVDYRITDTWEEILVDMPGEPVTDD
ncbi:hypothetical protein Tco_1126876, partial [Tanacetum coccineum]